MKKRQQKGIAERERERESNAEGRISETRGQQQQQDEEEEVGTMMEEGRRGHTESKTRKYLGMGCLVCISNRDKCGTSAPANKQTANHEALIFVDVI